MAVATRFERDPVLERADRVITLNGAMKAVYEQAGVDAHRLVEVPNFLAARGSQGSGGGPWVFAGRLVVEKGIRELIEEWPRYQDLIVVGDGPLRDAIAKLAGPNVTITGTRPPEEVRELLRQSRGLVFPSRWMEGFPMVYLEALAAGTPILAWEPSSVASMVKRQGTGLVVEDLIEALDRAEVLFPDLRQHCRSVFEERFTAAAWITTMERIYGEALAARAV